MKKTNPTATTRRKALSLLSSAVAGLATVGLASKLKAAVKNALTSSGAPKGYDPYKHKWIMVIDIDRCIGCGLCVEACKTENKVPLEPMYFRTWVERYIITKGELTAGESSGDVIVDSPNGGMHGFPPSTVPKENILRSFYVPKLCNLCAHSPCTQVCPVGATFDSPDGAILVDSKYCIGCGFCIQACPYGCRFLNPKTRTAEKCTLCYHRITKGYLPACVEVCPSGARISGDLKNPVPDSPLQKFFEKNRSTQTLKPHLGTEPRVLYAQLDKEVR
ncbi:MAG: 4Fe-4S dicluster domain-containing protein [Verrucomicrobiia bacterium]